MHQLVPEKQRRFAREVVHRLRDAGYLAYWAGGCVRDELLGRSPKDYDVATSATPPQVREVFGRRHTLEIGAAFGVICVRGGKESGQVEVATFRTDGDYSDGRRPDRVEFSSPEEDARRRDFTINGLFYDPLEQQVIDYVDGRADLAARVIRAIGDPQQRFREDKLRMLRAVRFAAAFNFALDDQTASAMASMAGEIAIVSAERIQQEMRGMLTGPHRSRAMQLLLDTGLLAVVLPELLPLRGLPQHNPRQPHCDLWDHTLLVLDELREPGFPLALAALLHDAGKPQTSGAEKGQPEFYDHETVGAQMTREVCRRWRMSRRDEEHAVWLVRHHRYLGQARQMRWAKLQRMLSQPGIEDLLELHEADARAGAGDISHVDYCWDKLQLPPEELSPEALLTGHDLIRHGVEPGQVFQTLLARVYEAQVEKKIHSKREALELVDQLLAERPDAEGGEFEPY